MSVLSEVEEVVDTDMTEGGALSHNNSLIDIYSSSWGLGSYGILVGGLGALAEMALEMGVREVGYQVPLFYQ